MYHFFAYLSRLKLIRRWGLMRSAARRMSSSVTGMVAPFVCGRSALGVSFTTGRGMGSRERRSRAMCWHSCERTRASEANPERGHVVG